MSFVLLTCVLAGPPLTPINSRLVAIENEFVCVGVDLDHGGSITWLSTTSDDAPERYRGRNLVNNFDLGRQIQMSHYAGPIPFTPSEQTPADHWKHLGWNPVQSGDDFGNGSKVISHTHTKDKISVATRPLHWPLDRVESEAIFLTDITLDGPIVRVTANAQIDRSDADQTVAIPRHQELPAVYVVSAFDTIRIPTVSGITNLTRKPTGWTYWTPTENWVAAVDDDGFGVGVFSPLAELFAGGVAGKGGLLDSDASPTTYLAPIKTLTLKPRDQFEYQFQLTIGREAEIVERFRSE